MKKTRAATTPTRQSKTAQKVSRTPKEKLIRVEVLITRWKDPTTGRFVENPFPDVSMSLKRLKGETLEERYMDGDLVKVYIKHQPNEYGYDIPVSARVVYPKARKAAKTGDLTLSALKELEADIAAGILEEEKAQTLKDMESRLMKAGHLSDKAKRAAATRKRNAERRAQAPKTNAIQPRKKTPRRKKR